MLGAGDLQIFAVPVFRVQGSDSDFIPFLTWRLTAEPPAPRGARVCPSWLSPRCCRRRSSGRSRRWRPLGSRGRGDPPRHHSRTPPLAAFCLWDLQIHLERGGTINYWPLCSWYCAHLEYTIWSHILILFTSLYTIYSKNLFYCATSFAPSTPTLA